MLRRRPSLWPDRLDVLPLLHRDLGQNRNLLQNRKWGRADLATPSSALSDQTSNVDKDVNSRKQGAAKEVSSSIGILLFLGLLRVVINGYFLANASAGVEEIVAAPDEFEILLTLVRAFYIVGMAIGAVFLACATLILKFPLICSYTAMVTFIISEIIGLLLNPFRLFSIGGWIFRSAVIGGLVQSVNNAHYYSGVKSGKIR